MFKTAACIVAAAAGLALSTSAMAQTFTPASSAVVLSGRLRIQQAGVPVECALRINVGINAAGAASVTGRTLSANIGGPNTTFCGTVVIPYGTWTMTSGVSSTFTLAFGVNTLLNKPCYGSINLVLSGGTAVLPPGFHAIPAVTFGDPQCDIVMLHLSSAPPLGV